MRAGSTRRCLGSPSQWATIREVFPEHFERVAQREAETGLTIRKNASIRQLADLGTPYPAALSTAGVVLAQLAQRTEWTERDLAILPGSSGVNIDRPLQTTRWVLPPGAFGENAGPT